MKMYFISNSKYGYEEIKYLFPFNIQEIKLHDEDQLLKYSSLHSLGLKISCHFRNDLIISQEEFIVVDNKKYTCDKIISDVDFEKIRKKGTYIYCNTSICTNNVILYCVNVKVAGYIDGDHELNQDFDFDKYFYPFFWMKTFSDLDFKEKCIMSHRGGALKKIMDFLTKRDLIKYIEK